MDTEQVNDTEIIIDWLQFTIKKTNPIDAIINLLGLEPSLFEELPKGKLGYKKQMFYNNISVLYDGNENMGTHIILSGQGCRYYELNDSLLDLIRLLQYTDAKITRIDLALDDRTGELVPFQKILKDIKLGNISSKWKSNIEIIKRDMNGNIQGQTINLGSRTSNVYLRIYDKALEQKIKGIWNRVELEIKKESAEKIQEILTADNAGLLFKGILNNYLRLLKPNKTDKNKSRWENREYWDNLISNVEKVKLTRKAEEKTIDEKKAWLSNQVGQTLALVSLADGNVDYIDELINENAHKLKLRNKKLLAKHSVHADALARLLNKNTRRTNNAK